MCYFGFRVWQQTFLLILGVTIGDSESTPAMLGVWTILIGFGYFGVLMIAEPYLRGGVRKGLLWPRFARLALGLAVALGLGLAVQAAIIRVG